MIVCPNCNHSNPEGAQACEACYTPLPATTSCPNCGASVQTDASFCGQCGANLVPSNPMETAASAATDITAGIPGSVNPPPFAEPEKVVASSSPTGSTPIPAMEVSMQNQELTNAPVPVTSESSSTTPASEQFPPLSGKSTTSKTQLQQQSAKLLHVQTDRLMELPQNISVVHIGKSNDRVPPDVDVSGFPNSEIVSRIHADIRVEGDAYYIEDVGSSNGTYINNMLLSPGNRHRLRPGDRISLGKGDLVTFLFQLS